jgi:ABC-type nitrate/sulfonate/bicarbonate transport system permease component
MLARTPWQTVARWVVAACLFFVAWEAMGRAGVVYGIRPFSETARTLWKALTDGELTGPTLGTLRIAATGYAIAVLVGVPVGMLTGLSKQAAQVLDPLINAAYATPMVMLIPVIGTYTGLEFGGKVFLVFTFCVFVIVMNTAAGIRSVREEYIAAGRAFGLSRAKIYRQILLPGAAPLILTALRVTVGHAISGAIVAELLLSVDNLGLYLVDTAARFQLAKLLAATFFLALLAMAAMTVARLVERWLVRWELR